MKRKDCPDCQRLFNRHFNWDIPSIVERSHEVFNDQTCRKEHNIDTYLKRGIAK